VRTNTCPDDAGAGYSLYLDPPALSYKLSTVHVPVGCNNQDFPTLRTLVNASVATWASAGSPVCTGLGVSYAGDAPGVSTVGVVDGQNVIVFRTRSCSDPGVVTPGDPCLSQGGCGNLYDCWEDATSQGVATLALTWVSFDTGSGQIHDADMELQDWNGSTTTPRGHYFTCASSGPLCTLGQQGCVWWDVGSVVTHEAGHMIGFDHVTGVDAVMNPTLGPGAANIKRTLRADDVAGVCAVYPPGGGAVRQKLPGWCVRPPSKGCGCEGGAAGALGWLALVPLLRLRRRP
jgi:hypothetical protein